MVSLNCRSVFGAVLGALNIVLGREPCTKHCRNAAEGKSLSRAVTINVFSILTQVSLALHPSVKTGQKLDTTGKVQYNLTEQGRTET